MLAVRHSFDRAKQANFAQKFYELLLSSSPAIREKFRLTNFDQQRELLIHGVYSMLDYAEGKSVGKLAIDRLATRHSVSDLAVNASMYDIWLSCFLKAIRATDPACSEELVRDWSRALEPALTRLRQASPPKHVGGTS